MTGRRASAVWLAVAVALGAGQLACRRTVNARPSTGAICRLDGTVLDAKHTPLEGARVSALPGNGRQSAPAVVTVSGGRFRMDLRAGFYTVHIVAPGFEDVWQTVVLWDPGTAQSREFVLEREESNRPHARKSESH